MLIQNAQVNLSIISIKIYNYILSSELCGTMTMRTKILKSDKELPSDRKTVCSYAGAKEALKILKEKYGV